MCFIPGKGRSPGEGNGDPLQYSCLENPMDRGAWWATVQGSQRVRHDWSDLAQPSYLQIMPSIISQTSLEATKSFNLLATVRQL